MNQLNPNHIVKIEYINPQGEYISTTKSLAGESAKEEVFRLLWWALKNNVELRIQPRVHA